MEMGFDGRIIRRPRSRGPRRRARRVVGRRRHARAGASAPRGVSSRRASGASSHRRPRRGRASL